MSSPRFRNSVSMLVTALQRTERANKQTNKRSRKNGRERERERCQQQRGNGFGASVDPMQHVGICRGSSDCTAAKPPPDVGAHMHASYPHNKGSNRTSVSKHLLVCLIAPVSKTLGMSVCSKTQLLYLLAQHYLPSADASIAASNLLHVCSAQRPNISTIDS